MSTTAPGAQTSAAVASSFRDPGGRLLLHDDRVVRLVNPQGAAQLRAFLASAAWAELSRTRQLPATRVLDVLEQERLLRAEPVTRAAAGLEVELALEHERVPFPSYPYEWPAEMLRAAAELTLHLASRAAAEGLGLKDATPYNVLFDGPRPVFVDVLSVEQRRADDPLWLAQAQFLRAFVLPLLVERRFGIPCGELLLSRRDGIAPEAVYRMYGPLERLRPPVLGLVTLPVWLSGGAERQGGKLYEGRSSGGAEQARFILQSTLAQLRRTLDRVSPLPERSGWTGYGAEPESYSEASFRDKEQFCRTALQECGGRRVLDAGCNTGHFSALAAQAGAKVVAVDADPAVVAAVWRRARQADLDILPLVVNLARPTPALGWRNRESLSFLERARGGFSLVLMLALVHHLLVTERIPLDEIVDLAADLTTDRLLIEWVGPDDPMFQRLTRGREELFSTLTRDAFESAFRQRFDLERDHAVSGSSRRLYVMRRRGTHGA
ncbi:MAG: Methyltransferase type 12 [Armatimonadetes bacterium]|nr:Methyltransferase type 12 [Armatimonadota bacterium]